MEYFAAIIIFLTFYFFTTILCGFFGLIAPIFYVILGFILGVDSIIIGVGGLLGSFVNLYVTNSYIKNRGAMSNAPRYSILSSSGFIMVFLGTIILQYLLGISFGKPDFLSLLFWGFILWILLSFYLHRYRNYSLEKFKNSVVKYKIVPKYEDEPQWATYLYFKSGNEGWNETIPGSFCAKDPKDDLTFVHHTYDRALSYAERSFPNAELIKD